MNPQSAKNALKSMKAAIALGLASSTAAFGQEAQPQTGLKGVFNNSEIASTGWSLPVATLGTNTTARVEVGYADITPGVYVRRKFDNGSHVDAGFMNFSENLFPFGDTLNFNSKGGLYSNGEQTGDQIGLRFGNEIELGTKATLSFEAFAGSAVNAGGAPSFGANADYKLELGHNWRLVAGAGAAWLGEKNSTALDAIGAVQKTFTYSSLPDGRLTAGVMLRDEFGRESQSRATAFAEYQTRFVKEGDGPAWLYKINGLFSAYAGTESHGGKVGLLFSPGTVSRKDFGVSFGPSVGWDSKQGGPQYNFELRTSF